MQINKNRNVMAKKYIPVPILGSIVKTAISMRNKMSLLEIGKVRNPKSTQEKELRKLLTKASNTSFGEAYKYKDILKEKDIVAAFKQHVPVHDYNSIFKQWWYRTLNGETFVCWPGKVNHFALSSGTSEASSKYIPVSGDMIKQIKSTSLRQVFSMAKYDFPNELYEKGILMLGGSTHLQYNGTYYEGDLSGITAGNIPFWFEHFYKPGKRISRERDWQTKLDEIVKKAPEWDIMAIVGVPAWLTILMEKIIERYNLKHIHEMWPNLSIFVHGGVSLEPYKKGLETLLGKPITYMETYLASEGFLAFQNRPNVSAMELVLNNGLFFEFVPFTDANFDEDGNIRQHPESFNIEEAEEGREYALLISTCSGAWRYLIGDTIKFTSKEHNEIVITVRTKSFLSICGEHLSVDNMNKAVKMMSDEVNITIKEFTVHGEKHGNMFAHQWYFATDAKLDAAVAAQMIDRNLGILNDDYRVERLEAIRSVAAKVFPTAVFYDYMRMQGKEGAQNKFPRVLKNEKIDAWQNYLKSVNLL